MARRRSWDGACPGSRLGAFIARLRDIRREKMVKAIDLILEKALPETPLKKQIHDRILFDIRVEKEKDILESAVLKPKRAFSRV